MKLSTKLHLFGTAAFGALLAVGVFVLDWNGWSSGLACATALVAYFEGYFTHRAEQREGTALSGDA